jgi:hypothetical protein
MTGLDIFAFIVMGAIAGSILIAAVFLGSWPGKIAARRNHPQAEAIKMCGWLGILTMGILWPVAYIWAYANPIRTKVVDAPDSTLQTTINMMKQRIADVEAEMGQLRQGEGGDQS